MSLLKQFNKICEEQNYEKIRNMLSVGFNCAVNDFFDAVTKLKDYNKRMEIIKLYNDNDDFMADYVMHQIYTSK